MMARKRSPHWDYICMRCGCPCDDNRHLGGGYNMRACGQAPHPILRSEYEEMIRRDLEGIKHLFKR
jgi:hypothetical protein